MFHPAISYYLPIASPRIIKAYRKAWLNDQESVVGDILSLFLKEYSTAACNKDLIKSLKKESE